VLTISNSNNRNQQYPLKGVNMAAKFTPLHDRILVRRIEEGETTRGGIIIPDSAKEKPQEGEVVSAGKGKINEEGKVRPLDVKEGDRILFGKYSGTEIKLDGEDFIIMREEEVLGILSGAAKKETAGSRR
jgi:chaperonin GroES